MPPGPTKQFEIDVALNRAMTVFWEKGYAATSMTDLQDRMGIGARSLYATFGNKRTLFIKTLDHYTATLVHAVYGDLDAAKTSGDAISSVVGAVQRANERTGGRGCFLGVAMAQIPRDDAELISIVRGHVVVMEDALCAAFTHSRKQRRLAQSARPRDLARFYVALFQGLNLVARVDPDGKFAKSTSRVLASTRRKTAVTKEDAR